MEDFLIMKRESHIKELEEAIKEEMMNQGDWSEMQKTLEWIN